MNTKMLATPFLVLLMIGIMQSYATNEIIIDTNKASYAPGDLVELTGKVKDSPNQVVAIEVKDTAGNTIVIRTVETDSDGNFVLKFKVPSFAKAGKLEIVSNAIVNGTKVTETKTVTANPSSSNQQPSAPQATAEKKGGGCLIATAAFGSELAPQVQILRELRDKTVLGTQSGTSFVNAFNAFYYSFSPTVADWERENPVFKEIVKTTITPLITTLSILNYVDIDSEAKMLGYGIGIILLNI